MEPLIIKLEIQAMQASILHALQQRHGEIERLVKQSLDKLDVAGIVEKIVQEQAPRLIQECVSEAVRSGLGWEFKKALSEQIQPVVMQALQKGTASE